MTNKAEIHCMQLFSTPVLVSLMTNHDTLNDNLRKLISENRSQNEGIQKSNIGGWHSQDDLMLWAPDESQAILTFAIQICTKYTADIHPTGKRDFKFKANMWANINQKGDSNNTHCHPGCLWSGVYYVDAGMETDGDEVGGHLIFEDPRFPTNSMYQPELVLRSPDGVPQRTQHSVTPKSSMLVMFPSWLRHSVRPYKGNKDRISVAFNLMVNEG